MEYGYDIVSTDDGGYLLAGLSYTFSSGSSDFYLVKTDAYGVAQWSESYGGVSADFPTRIKATSDGGFVMAGTTASSGQGFNDAYVVKINAMGDTLWTRTYGDWYNELLFDIDETSDQGFIMVGRTQSFSNISGEVYLIKTNSTGDTTFTKRYGGSSLNWGIAVEQTADNGYLITGKTESFGAGGQDVYVIRTDQAGDTLWTKTFGGNMHDFSNDLHLTSDGGFIMLGTHNSGDIDGLTGDIFLEKVSSTGVSEWQQSYGGAGGEFANKMVKTQDGGYFLVGATNTIGAGNFDMYAIKTDGAGNMLWDSTFGGSGIEAGYGVVETASGGYAMVGRTGSIGAGQDDMYLVYLDGSGSLDISESTIYSQMLVDVYPNPITDKALMTFNGFNYGDALTLEVFDATGKKCLELNNIQENSIELRGEHLSSGMFFFKVYDSSANIVGNGKFVVR